MSIIYDTNQKSFHLTTKNTSYILQIHEEGYIAHVYYGRKLKNFNSSNLLTLSQRPYINNCPVSLDSLLQEYPSYGAGDFRNPAYSIQLENGSTITDLRYESHTIVNGKPPLEGLPATYVEDDNEAQTLEITLFDSLIGLKVILSYTAFENYDAMTRNVRFINCGNEDLKLLRALSMSIDFNNSDYDFLHLHGSWGRERHIERTPLLIGTQLIESRRGASSHQQNPFIALLGHNANEEYGDVYGFNLIYSGSFLAQAEVDQFKTTRISFGINPFDFSWLLKPNESFQTPEVVMVYSSNGLGEMSRTYHKLYRQRLCRGIYRDKTRPILVNNWEGTYFDFDAEKIENIGKVAQELGVELFVLDDGWFGKRDSDNCSLGDWVVNRKKLPNGLEDLANRINNLDLEFGLWFEPEMVSPDSDLYRAHPDWCIHVPERHRTQARNQLILDLSRKEACDYIVDSLTTILSSVNISYIKWDMNRNMTEIGSPCLPPERQRETAHRYMLGLYKILEKLTAAFPNILFEGCASGGGRFDGGILYYMPQIWTSDDSDAVERLKIQYGTSIVYPISTMGAHVSAVPNHQVHRTTSLKMRGDVAMSGNFGYELDLTKFTDEEKETVKKQVASYKELRELIQFGDMYRLLNPFDSNEASWIIVSEDKTEAFVSFFRVLGSPNGSIQRLYLKGLDPNKSYLLDSITPGVNVFGIDEVLNGDELMYGGITIPNLEGDYQSVTWTLKAN